MINLKTGNFTFGDGYELYRNMTLEEFKNGKLYEEMLLHESKRTNKNELCYSLKDIKINGIDIAIVLWFSKNSEVLHRIVIPTPEFYKWPEWPENNGPKHNFEYEYKILEDLNKVLAYEMQGSVESGRGLSFDYPWGEIETRFHPNGASMSPPDIKIFVRYYKELMPTFEEWLEEESKKEKKIKIFKQEKKNDRFGNR